MSKRDWIARVHLPTLRAYLLEHGWGVKSQEDRLWTDSEGAIYQFPDRLESTLDFLSVNIILDFVFDRNPNYDYRHLIDRTKAGAEDVLYFGCELPHTKPGLLPVRRAESYYRAATKMLRDTARTQSPDNQGYADKLLNDSHFGEVRAASYSVAMHIPVSPIPNPLGRRVLSQMSYRMDALFEANDKEDFHPLVEDGIRQWSPKMCRIIDEFIKETETSEIKVQAIPDPTVKSDVPVIQEEIRIPINTTITRSILAEASSSLVQLRDAEIVEVTGVPTRVQNNTIFGDPSRTVGIHWVREGKPPVRVTVELSEDDFRKCLDSMKTEAPISVRGRLKRNGTHWHLENPDQIVFSFHY